MDSNTRRAIIARVKKGWNMKAAFTLMKKDPRYKALNYSAFNLVKEDYIKKQVINWYKWCNMCWCKHPYTYEVFWYNWFNADWTRRLHSVCLAWRLRLKKNIILMKWEKHKKILESQRRNRIKNKWNWVKKKINEMTPEEQVIQRAKRKKYSADKYLRQKNVKKKIKQ